MPFLTETANGQIVPVSDENDCEYMQRIGSVRPGMVKLNVFGGKSVHIPN